MTFHYHAGGTPLLDEIKKTHPHNVTYFVDFDDCLDRSTVRALNEEQKQILWDLHHLTKGGFILTTNSDGRSVFEMDGMAGFPVISEFGTVFRNITNSPKGAETEIDKHGNDVTYLHKRPDCKKAFEIANQLLNARGIAVTNSGEDLNGDTPIVKLEGKEMGIALVFGRHASVKPFADEIADKVYNDAGFNRSAFEIDKKGKDAVEIKVKDAAKADVGDHLNGHALMRRSLLISVGDSGSDWELMQRLGRGIVVGHALDSKIKTTQDNQEKLKIHKVDATLDDFTNTWLLLRTLRDTYAQQAVGLVVNTGIAARKAPAPR